MMIWGGCNRLPLFVMLKDMINIINNLIFPVLCLLILFPLSAISADGPTVKTAPLNPSATPAAAPADTTLQKYGIEIKSLTLTANGHMLDLRYRVKEPEKAKPFLNPEIKPYLIDSKRNMKLSVPITPKIGSLRQKTRTPEAGREYFMLFNNPGMRIRPENRVTLVVGDIKIEDIVVK